MIPPDYVEPSVSRRMAQAVSADTKPELKLRQALHRAGRRFRVQYRVPGLPRRSVDIAFTRSRVAVMVDGCFWHVCPEHASWPRNNADWWRSKLAANVARDRETDRLLEALGWIVVRVWEHERIEAAVEKVLAAIDRVRADLRMVA